MKKSIHNQLANRKRRIASRLDRRNILVERQQPLFSAAGIQYEVADRVRGIAAGGIGGMQMVAEGVGWRRTSTGRFTCSNAICPTTNRITC